MKNFYTVSMKALCRIICIAGVVVFSITANAQKATVAIPVGIGNPCTSSASDSVKYFDYNSLFTNTPPPSPKTSQSPSYSSHLLQQVSHSYQLVLVWLY